MNAWLARLFGGAAEPARVPHGAPAELAQVEPWISAQRAYFRADGGDVELAGVRDG